MQSAPKHNTCLSNHAIKISPDGNGADGLA